MYLAIKAITDDKKMLIQRKKDLTFSTVDEEVIMLNIQNEEYYYLNKVGTKIWHEIEKPISFEDLVSRMKANYQVDESEYIIEIQEFLYELNELNLLEFQKKTE